MFVHIFTGQSREIFINDSILFSNFRGDIRIWTRLPGVCRPFLGFSLCPFFMPFWGGTALDILVGLLATFCGARTTDPPAFGLVAKPVYYWSYCYTIFSCIDLSLEVFQFLVLFGQSFVTILSIFYVSFLFIKCVEKVQGNSLCFCPYFLCYVFQTNIYLKCLLFYFVFVIVFFFNFWWFCLIFFHSWPYPFVCLSSLLIFTLTLVNVPTKNPSFLFIYIPMFSGKQEWDLPPGIILVPPGETGRCCRTAEISAHLQRAKNSPVSKVPGSCDSPYLGNRRVTSPFGNWRVATHWYHFGNRRVVLLIVWSFKPMQLPLKQHSFKKLSNSNINYTKTFDLCLKNYPSPRIFGQLPPVSKAPGSHF